MPRARIVATVSEASAINGAIKVVSASSVTITNHETAAAVSVYTTETGGTLATGLTTDALGRVIASNSAELWADPQNLRIVATKGGDTYTIFYSLLSAADLGGRELGYAEIGDAGTSIAFSTASTTAVDIPGMSLPITVGSRPIRLIMSAFAMWNSTVNGGLVVQIQEGATVLGSVSLISNPANLRVPLHREIRLAPSAGAHTYKLTGFVVSGTGNVGGNPTTNPFSFSAVEV